MYLYTVDIGDIYALAKRHILRNKAVKGHKALRPILMYPMISAFVFRDIFIKSNTEFIDGLLSKVMDILEYSL